MSDYYDQGWDEPPHQPQRGRPPQRPARQGWESPPQYPQQGWGPPPQAPRPAKVPWWRSAWFVGLVTLFVGFALGSLNSGGDAEPAAADAAAAAQAATPGTCLQALDLAEAGEVGGGSYNHVATDCRNKAATAPAAGGDAPVAAEEAPAEPAPEEAPAGDAGLGQEVEDGKFTFVVHSVDCGETTIGTNEFLKADAQGVYCMFSITVRNHGDEAQHLISSAQKLIDGQGRTFDHADEAWAALDDTPLLEQINPGNQVDGTLVFDVPQGTAVTTLELHDSLFSGGARVTVG